MSSIGSSGGGISFGGLSSGIDTASIIKALLSVEQQPLLKLQQHQAEVQNRQAVYQAFASKLTAIATAAQALNSATAFTTVTGSSSNASAVTVTATSNATSGTYELAISKIAQSQKISSAAQTNTTDALNLAAGTFVINGRSVSVTASDSLKSIAQKINGAGAGVTASLIDGGAGASYLTLTSGNTGVVQSISMTDISGTALSSLGLLDTNTTTIRQPVNGGAGSATFANQSQSLQTLMPGLPASMSMTVDGQVVNVDTTTDTLQSLANKLSTLTNVSASVVSGTDKNGATTYQLQITNKDGTTPTFDAGPLTSSLGIVQSTAKNQLVAAQDASYTLDGIHLTSSSNSISTAIPGATFNLLSATNTDGTPAKATINLTQDTSGITTNVQGLIDAYNGAIDFIKSQSQFDAKTFQSGVLFGDQTASQVQSRIVNMVIASVPGISGQYRNLESLGFSIDTDNKLSLNNTTFTNALVSNPGLVSQLFQASGASNSAALNYVASTTKTVAAGAGSYAVNITQAATKASFTGELAQTATSTASETLTFNGALFGSTLYQVTIPVGSTAADTVRQINSDAKLKDMVTASLDSNGKLLIASKKYGANGNFTVGSSLGAAADNSGIGYGGTGTYVTGLDVAGTINGEVATGSGQYLTGNKGNATTEGLQVSYTGVLTGNVGAITLTKGVSSQMESLMSTFTDVSTGLLTATQTSITTELTNIAKDITDTTARVAAKQAELTAKYNHMEIVIAQLRQQQQQLSAFSTSNN